MFKNVERRDICRLDSYITSLEVRSQRITTEMVKRLKRKLRETRLKKLEISDKNIDMDFKKAYK